MLKKKLKKCWKSPIFNVFLTIFNIFSKKFSTYFFQVFFGFLESAITKQNFILMVKSQFPKWFGLQKEKRNMQKQHLHPEILRFLDVTFSSLEAKPLRKLTFHHKGRCQKHPEGGCAHNATAFGCKCVLPPFFSSSKYTPPIFSFS